MSGLGLTVWTEEGAQIHQAEQHLSEGSEPLPNMGEFWKIDEQRRMMVGLAVWKIGLIHPSFLNGSDQCRLLYNFPSQHAVLLK